MTPLYTVTLCRYRYDALDRLTGHTQPVLPDLHRFYCKSRLATELQGALHYSIFEHGEQPLAQRRRAEDARETTLLATDAQCSVLQVLNTNQPQRPIAYSPYGHRPVENALLSLLGFNGERQYPATGYYLLGNGHRAFNPVLMRFVSPDSMSPFDKGGLNAYAYCLGDPINLHDPTGNFAILKSIIASISDHAAWLKFSIQYTPAPRKLIVRKLQAQRLDRKITKLDIQKAQNIDSLRMNILDRLHAQASSPSLFQLAANKLPGEALDLLKTNYDFPLSPEKRLPTSLNPVGKALQNDLSSLDSFVAKNSNGNTVGFEARYETPRQRDMIDSMNTMNRKSDKLRKKLAKIREKHNV